MNQPCCDPKVSARRLHVGLGVTDVSAATDFYRALFDAEPAKVREDYAKFELDDPALTLSLVPKSCCGSDRADHFGLRLQEVADVDEAAALLEARGLDVTRESGVCCHARSEKAWIHDPDGNPWEVYTVLEDVD